MQIPNPVFKMQENQRQYYHANAQKEQSKQGVRSIFTFLLSNVKRVPSHCVHVPLNIGEATGSLSTRRHNGM